MTAASSRRLDPELWHARGCLAGSGQPCKDTFGDQFEDTIRNTTHPSLVEALNAVHAKAPKATGSQPRLPWIMPETDGCYPQMPVSKGDVPLCPFAAADAERCGGTRGP